MTTAQIDTHLKLVANQWRRQLIQQLRDETNGQTTIDEVVTQIYQEGSIGGHEQSPSRKQLTVELSHTHVPTLVDHGVVEHELETGTLRYQPDEHLEAVLDGLPEQVPHTNMQTDL